MDRDNHDTGRKGRGGEGEDLVLKYGEVCVEG